jgi:uncharacterized protein (UPF0212 family)
VSEASTSVFKLRKSDIHVTEVPMSLYIYKCPLCKKRMTSVYKNKLIASVKLHLERMHQLKVEVVEE